MPSETLKKEVMRRVYAVYFLKTVLKPVAFEFIFLVFLVGFSAFFVSFPNIFKNFLAIGGLQARAAFFVSAFIVTGIVVKVVCVLAIGVLVYGFLGFIKGLRRVRLIGI